ADAGHEDARLIEPDGTHRGRVREGRLAVDHRARHAERACHRLLHGFLEAELVVVERRGDSVHAMAWPERCGRGKRAVETAGKLDDRRIDASLRRAVRIQRGAHVSRHRGGVDVAAAAVKDWRLAYGGVDRESRHDAAPQATP